MGTFTVEWENGTGEHKSRGKEAAFHLSKWQSTGLVLEASGGSKG